MKINIAKLKQIIEEAITASDKGVVDFPDKEKVATMPGGSAVKLSAMPSLIQDLVDSKESEFVEQGFELGDTSYDFDDGTTKKAVEEEKLSLVRAALGDYYNVLSEGDMRRLGRLVGKKVWSSEGFFVWSNEAMKPDAGNAGEMLLSDDQMIDIENALAYHMSGGTARPGKWTVFHEKAWDLIKEIAIRLSKVLVIDAFELSSWVGNDGFTSEKKQVGISPSGRVLEKYVYTINDPTYSRLHEMGKFIISADYQIFER